MMKEDMLETLQNHYLFLRGHSGHPIVIFVAIYMYQINQIDFLHNWRQIYF